MQQRKLCKGAYLNFVTMVVICRARVYVKVAEIKLLITAKIISQVPVF